MNLIPLSQVCRIVNGGTPKSGVEEYWGGDVAWLTPAEMGKLAKPEIDRTVRTITEAGLRNCSAKQVPAGSIILSTRAPIGHLAITQIAMAFNQGCRGLVPGDKLDAKYLYYFLWFSREALNDLGTGTTFKELSSGALAAYRIPLRPLEEQRRIVAVLDEAFAATSIATTNLQKQLGLIANLRHSVLAKAFAGEFLPVKPRVIASNDNFRTPEFAAHVLATAFERHASRNRERTFGTVKAQKTLQMVEAIGGLDLGRRPIRAAAGPDDAKHRHAALDWARESGFFEFRERPGGGHVFHKLPEYDSIIVRANAAVTSSGSSVIKSIDLLIDMDTDFAELVATTHAAWNNLLHDGKAANEATIVKAARDDWHVSKHRFDVSRFNDAIRFIEKQGLVPDGSAKYVGGQEALPL